VCGSTHSIMDTDIEGRPLGLSDNLKYISVVSDHR